MKLQFSMDYLTKWGEDVRVALTLTDAKGRAKTQLCPLETHDGRKWMGEVNITDQQIQTFQYKYCIYKGDECMRTEWNVVPREFRADMTKSFLFPDAWRDAPSSSYLYTSAFTQCVQPHHVEKVDLPYFSSTLMLRVSAPQLAEGQVLALLGNQPALGEWNPNFALRMSEVALHEWSITLSAPGLKFPLEYKYVIIDAKTGEFVDWEGGENRVIPMGVAKEQVLVLTDKPLRVPDKKWKAAGVVIPVFSLRSEGSCGVGDFGDLRQMVDWAVLTGMRVIQILPIYDTTIHKNCKDSYPYNSISIYALHPQYMDLRQLPVVGNDVKRKNFEARRKQLNELSQLDYEGVNNLKWEYLHEVFAQEGEEVLASSEYKEFFKQNEYWLMSYAAFSVLRDRNQTSDFHFWKEYSEYRAEDIRSFCKPDAPAYKEISYYYYIQFRLHQQLLAACDYARAKGVILKGDIPIGISRHSVESWVEPYYFNMNGQAGAPPDDFSVNGQNWGFPTYNWDVMRKDGCSWWVRRFKKMAEYFNAYRIDHVLGFFRIWEIPTDSVHGLLGHFSPALPMSVEEIENYGLRFRKSYFTKPYINDWVLEKIFGKEAENVKGSYLTRVGADWYEMKPEYETQRKVEAAFYDRTSDADIMLREGLYALISNVLFVEDTKEKGKYHPRISAQHDYLYQTLSGSEREAFNKLYNDYYFYRHNDFWYDQAMQKLPVLVDATQMLVCAEDLGMVPECVPWVMNDLHILTLEIQTMPKKYGIRFGRLEENPYPSVATIFTHDMPTLRGWWEEDQERAQQYFNEILQKDGAAPTVMPAWLCEEVVARHLYSPSMLCLVSWQDWLSMDENLRYPDVNFERINIPSDPHNYWRYRMHMTLETLMQCNGLNQKIRSMIERSDR